MIRTCIVERGLLIPHTLILQPLKIHGVMRAGIELSKGLGFVLASPVFVSALDNKFS